MLGNTLSYVSILVWLMWLAYKIVNAVEFEGILDATFQSVQHIDDFLSFLM